MRPHHPSKSFRRRFSLASSLMMLVGCAVGPDHQPPEAPGFLGSTIEQDPAFKGLDSDPAQRWWRALNDPSLTTLIERAFAENRDLRQAVANVEAARARARLQRTDLRPTAEASAAYERRRLAGAAFGVDDQLFPDTDFVTLGASAAWELDFVGRVRRLNEAALAEAGAAEALRRDAQSLVAAETARAYVDYRGAALSLAVAERNRTVQAETVSLTRVRMENGMGSRLDLVRAEAQLRTTEARIPRLEAARIAAANRLATLTASPVAEIETLLADENGLPALPDAVAIGDVEGLMRRRADIRAAERMLAAATARVGIAQADYFPRVTLVGSASVSAVSLGGLDEEGAFGYGIGPSLSWAGFDLPRVAARVDAADATADAAFAAYEQTVLTALEETQTALARHGRERVRYGALAAATERSREAASLARDRLAEGVDDFIDVLDAESRLLEAEASLADSQITALSSFIDVHRALGAGWLPPAQDPARNVSQPMKETE